MYKYRNKSHSVLIVLIIVMISLMLSGCQSEKSKLKAAKEQWMAIHGEELKNRKNEVEVFLLDYFSKKYHEEFISHGLMSANLAWDMEDRTTATLEFHMESAERGIHFKPEYCGAYVHPETVGEISDYKYIVDQDYWINRQEYDFTQRENGILNSFFKGYKSRINVGFSMNDPPYSFEFYRKQVTLDPKYLDIEYYLNEEKDKLNLYYITMDYFRDVNPLNKDELLGDIYDFILYTRSLGFKHCFIDINIFDEDFRNSEVYQQYLEDDEGVSLIMYCRLKNIRNIMVNISSETVDKILTLEDLVNLEIIREHKNDKTYKW